MGIQGRSIENTAKIAILEFLKDQKEPVGFEAIVAYCKEKYGISRGTVKTYLDDLKRSGFAEQSVNGRHPYNITEKGKEFYERESLKRELNGRIDKASTQEIKRLIKKLEYQELQSRFYKMLMEPLPEHVIIQKLEELGLKPEDYKIFKTTVCESEFFDEYSIEDIEFLLVPNEDESYIEVNLAVGDPFRLVAYIKPVKVGVYAAYKESINLCEQLEKLRVDLFKEDFGLSDEDLKQANPKVLERLSHEDERWMYVASKKPNAFEMFLKYYMREGLNEKIAKRLAENNVSFYQALEKEAEVG